MVSWVVTLTFHRRVLLPGSSHHIWYSTFSSSLLHKWWNKGHPPLVLLTWLMSLWVWGRRWDQAVLICNYFYSPETETPQKWFTINFQHNHKSWIGDYACNENCNTHLLPLWATNLSISPCFPCIVLHYAMTICKMEPIVQINGFYLYQINIYFTMALTQKSLTDSLVGLYYPIRDILYCLCNVRYAVLLKLISQDVRVNLEMDQLHIT